MSNNLKILLIGDIVGKTGRLILQDKLQGIIDMHRIDLVIANGENAAGGMSITPKSADEIFSSGVDIITTGNHVWDKKDVYDIINSEPNLIRPANYPDCKDGKGFCSISVKGKKITVINLLGRTMMAPVDCPFKKFDEIYYSIKKDSDIIIVDLHAEATSEKRSFGWYADGRASLVVGTHTHVQTADEEIFPGGTGYITDLGMTGAFDSVIGMDKDISIKRFLTQIRIKFEVAKGNPKINGLIVEIGKDGKTAKIDRIVK